MRDSWRHVVARVVSIGGTTEGKVNLRGLPDGGKESVYAETYDISNTDTGYLFKQSLPKFGVCPLDKTLSIVSCPGTYAYTKLDLSGKHILVQRLGESVPQPLSEPIVPTFLHKRKNMQPDAGHKAEAVSLSGKYGGLEVFYEAERETFSVRFPYSPELVECIKAAPPSLRSYEPNKKVWTLDLSCAATVAELVGLASRK